MQNNTTESSPRVCVGTDNVLHDLGFPDAAEMTAKSKIALQIVQIVRRNGWTQKEVAARVSLAQPDISNIMNARLAGMSLERLLGVLTQLGFDVEVRISEEAHEQAGSLVVA